MLPQKRNRIARTLLLLTAAATAVAEPTPAAESEAGLTPRLESLTATNTFPLAVWLQNPNNAPAYRRAGFNLYVGLWEGPTEGQLRTLQQAEMPVICAQNEVALRLASECGVLAWMHNDEPDNGQSRGARFGFGSPVAPAAVVAEYQRLKARDPSRPILLNLGQGVAWDDWYGRGRRNHHPEDYPEYLRGCDIASFDIYPMNHGSAAVAGDLTFVARGVERLRQWTDNRKPVWNCIECTRIGKTGRKPTPAEVRAEVWMALIHGSRGLIYFVHQFEPTFKEAALLADPEMLAAVTALNRQIAELAPVLNAPAVRESQSFRSTNAPPPVASVVKRHEGGTYVFAVAMGTNATMATLAVEGFRATSPVEVLGENRSLTATNGAFSDRFGPWDVHLYRLR
jgi:hypothetical protein